MTNYKEMESCANHVQDSIKTTYQVDNKVATVESYFDGTNQLFDILFEIARKRLAQN